MTTVLLNLLALAFFVASISLLDDLEHDTPHSKWHNRILLASTLMALSSTRLAAWQNLSLPWTVIVMIGVGLICYGSLYIGLLEDEEHLAQQKAKKRPSKRSTASSKTTKTRRRKAKARAVHAPGASPQPSTQLPHQPPAPDVASYQAASD